MDTGHYNCRDYYISPHFAPTTISHDIRSPFHRHESYDELEQRSRSPASFKPKFPLLKLPLELRQQIFSYLLPRTLEHKDPNPLASHARNFSAVKKRGARGMDIPPPSSPLRGGAPHIVWQRGNINLFRVCRQLHDECADMMYGGNMFLLFVTYSGVVFRYSWLLKSGLSPHRRYDFLATLPARYLLLVRRVLVNIEHLDSYTAMINFNVSGPGLTHGLRRHVQRLVYALQPPSVPDDTVAASSTKDTEHRVPDALSQRRLIRVIVKVSNGSHGLDLISHNSCRVRESIDKVSTGLEQVLEPFGTFQGVRDVSISGAISDDFARALEAKMKSLRRDDIETTALTRAMRDLEVVSSPQLCVYGNDMT